MLLLSRPAKADKDGMTVVACQLEHYFEPYIFKGAGPNKATAKTAALRLALDTLKLMVLIPKSTLIIVSSYRVT